MPSKTRADKSKTSSSAPTKSSLNPLKETSGTKGKGQEEPTPKATVVAPASKGKRKAPVRETGDEREDASNAKPMMKAKDGQKATKNDSTTAKETASSKPSRKRQETKEIEEEVDEMDIDEDEDDYVTEENDDDIEDSDEESQEEDDGDGDGDSDTGGIDEEGMARLMKALGKDGLDELGQAQLNALEEGSGEEDQDASDLEDEEISRGESEEEESELEIAEDAVDDDSKDEDEDVESEAEPKIATAKESKKDKTTEMDVEAEDEEEEEGHIPLDEAEDVDDDAVPRRKVVMDNKVALDRIRESIRLDPSLPWTETLTMTYPEKIEVDVDDDLNRELAFYKQALHGANQARSLAHQHNFPFTRPADYFAEMVKSDSHMERIRQRLLDESASLKRSEEKRREREGKKFGKQVQIEKLKERERSKKEFGEKVKGLKRKRKDVLNSQPGGDDDFDVAVEDAINDRPSKRARGGDGKPKLPRKARDQKYGFGGAGKRSKQNTKSSTDDFDASKKVGGKFNSAGRKTGKPGKGAATKRPGKSRRMSARSRK